MQTDSYLIFRSKTRNTGVLSMINEKWLFEVQAYKKDMYRSSVTFT